MSVRFILIDTFQDWEEPDRIQGLGSKKESDERMTELLAADDNTSLFPPCDESKTSTGDKFVKRVHFLFKKKKDDIKYKSYF